MCILTSARYIPLTRMSRRKTLLENTKQSLTWVMVNKEHSSIFRGLTILVTFSIFSKVLKGEKQLS